MEFDENLNPVNPPTQPNPWDQPLPYQPPATPPPITPPAPVQPTPFFNLPPTPPLKLIDPIPLPPKTYPPFPVSIFWMMFIITLASLGFAFFGQNNPFGWSSSKEGITVTGTGTAYSAPDVAKIDFGVRSSAHDLATSQKMNADAIAKIKNDLAPSEIAPEDIQTINYNINPDYIYSPSQKPTLSGYTTYHFLRLTMHKLDMVDAILQTLGKSGATDISQITFAIEDPAEVKNDAREKAIATARDMADQLSALSGAKLGKIISIKEEIANATDNTQPYANGMGGGGSGPGIEQGSLSVISTVTITYSLR